MKSTTTLAAAFAAVLLVVSGCQPEDAREPFQKPIDPGTQKSQLSKSLQIIGSNKPGASPQEQSPGTIQINYSSRSASVTSDNTLFIPFIYQAQDKLAGVYLQIEGADNYWEIPISTDNDKAHVLSVGIPGNVLNGKFNISYRPYDAQGRVGKAQKLPTTIVAAESSCGKGNGFPRVEGNDGITVRSYDLGEVPGKVKISWNTFTIKDRVDIRYGNQWIGSTDDVLLAPNEAPPAKDCDDVTTGDGFVGGVNQLVFDYDPSKSRKLDIYVSGCLNGGTQWYFDITCPDGGAGPGPGNYLCDDKTIQDQFDSKDPQYHFFPGTQEEAERLTTELCDPATNPKCNERFAFEAMLENAMFIAPNAPGTPVEDCKAVVIGWYDPIRTKVNRSDLTVTNYTIAGYQYGLLKLDHRFHPGKITRKIWRKNGKVVVSTEGVGVGGQKLFNEVFGPYAFLEADVLLKGRVAVKLLQ